MKTKLIISVIAISIAVVFSCKKESETPTGGNKIEIGQSTTDTLSYYNAKVSTTITATGGNEISQHGHCWNTAKEPTTENNKTTLGKLTEPKTYTSELTNLTDNTTYFVRSYVTYKNGTVYGAEQTIQTLKTGKPIVTTSQVSDVTGYTAVCTGNVIADSGSAVVTSGFCWDTIGNPTLENNIGFTNNGNSIGSFTSEILGLTDGLICFIAAYATNERGTSYGEVLTFETLDLTPCNGETSFIYQGQTYHTVEIEYQCWMKENLNYNVGNSWCYDNNDTNCEIYGRLYDWASIMNGEASSNAVPSGVQGICPDGWHLPSDKEWDILVDYLGGSDVAGGKMKQADTTHWSWPNTDATNSSGFTALPGGYHLNIMLSDSLGYHGDWWSSTESSGTKAWYRGLYYSSGQLYRCNYKKAYGFSVRCLKD